MNCEQSCAGCAFTPGAAANLEPENNLTALICAWGPLPFWCHDHLDWQKPMTKSEKRAQIREHRVGICQGWVREVQRLKAIGYYQEQRAARKAFAVLAIEQLNIMKSDEFDEADKAEAKKDLEFYVRQLCELEMKRLNTLRSINHQIGVERMAIQRKST